MPQPQCVCLLSSLNVQAEGGLRPSTEPHASCKKKKKEREGTQRGPEVASDFLVFHYAAVISSRRALTVARVGPDCLREPIKDEAQRLLHSGSCMNQPPHSLTLMVNVKSRRSGGLPALL